MTLKFEVTIHVSFKCVIVDSAISQSTEQLIKFQIANPTLNLLTLLTIPFIGLMAYAKTMDKKTIICMEVSTFRI